MIVRSTVGVKVPEAGIGMAVALGEDVRRGVEVGEGDNDAEGVDTNAGTSPA